MGFTAEDVAGGRCAMGLLRAGLMWKIVLWVAVDYDTDLWRLIRIPCHGISGFSHDTDLW